MRPSQNEIETFLLADLVLSLSNIRAHLDWEANYARCGTVMLSAESVASLSENLLSIERKSKSLAKAMRATGTDGQSLAEILRRFEEEFAA